METGRSLCRRFLCVLFVLDLVIAQGGDSELSPPCMGCRLFNLANKEHPEHKPKSASKCEYPCYCPLESLECQSGVNIIKDGCGCCRMCARQLGDMCSVRDKCDVTKRLYCSFQDGNSTGRCFGEEKKSCEVMGAVYKDGEKFYMGCSKLCTCQNGFHGCIDLCPQERLKPSELTCHNPKLIKVKSKCCREWTCQKLDSSGQLLSRHPDLESQNLIMKNPMWYRTSIPPPTSRPLPPQPPHSMSCEVTKSDWSPCSVTCGVGVSLRLVVNKKTCENEEEQQLCFLRPCGVKLATLGRDKCTPTTRSAGKRHIQFQDCISVRKYKPKHCTNCWANKCCYPKLFRTKMIEFQCTGGNTEVMNFMWIKKCQCRSTCNQKESGRNETKTRRRRKFGRGRRNRKERRRRRKKWRRKNKRLAKRRGKG